ncbi:hypothetical protein AGMMS49950_11260 [Endomicrobiia bacterium]|nr:hypothetical protein AGMMS49950_11260 [Endomicrobiia bacterium]
MKKAKTRRSRLCIKNVLAIIVMFACTSICFGDPDPIILDASSTVDITHGKAVAGNSNKPDGTANDGNIFPLDPNGRTLTVGNGAEVGEASGAYIDDNSSAVRSMTGNKIIVRGGNFNYGDINGACSLSTKNAVKVNDNTVEINAGEKIWNVNGGHTLNGTVSDNKVFIEKGVTIGRDVNGGCVLDNGNAEKNEVTITSATVGYVYGGYVGRK